MSKHKSSNRSFFFLLLLGIGIYAYYSFWSMPELPRSAPMLTTVAALAVHPTDFHGQYVMLQDAGVDTPTFFCGRSVFWATDPQGETAILSISPIYRAMGSPLNRSVFFFEIVYGQDDHCFLLLREVQYPSGRSAHP